MDDLERIENLYNNINYIIIGTEDGWLDVGDPQLVKICYQIKALSEHTHDELFKFDEKKKMLIKLKK